ncbi:MAG: penicillin acylase family protein [Candidatus Krumholzibacteriia bacterium]
MPSRRPGPRWLRRLVRILLLAVASLVTLALLAALAVVLLVRGSLPRLDGRADLAGLAAPVSVTRDSLGVPDITADSRADLARALGYLHAQDRFFQMDLQRRAAAGELAALLGPALLDTDRDVRRHRFRTRAEQVVRGLGREDRGLLEAYTDGVNAGLTALRSRPPEYLVLRQRPAPWRPADTILTLLAMCVDLSLDTAYTEAAYGTVRDTLPPALVELLLPRSNPWNAPLQTEAVPGIVLPDSATVDVRRWTFDGKSYGEVRTERVAPTRHDTAGSNNWAVAGPLTGHGGAILANDMHLAHGLPNIWYRCRMTWRDGDRLRTTVGVTLPGTHVMVVGSNGQVAWGFTNSMGDWADLVILERDPARPTRYLTPAGWADIERLPEVIEVAGAPADTLWVEETIWGPVWSTDTCGRTLALRWTAHDPEALNLNLRHLETASDVDAAVRLAGSLGIPPQNLVCADAAGRIAWALAGRIPRRVGWDGRVPMSWADGACRWDGYLDPAEEPRLIDPPDGLLWTANNRVAAGHDLALIGDGGYALGARARQIRDGLAAMDHGRERDHLALQLDDRALMLERWRGLALAVLDRAPGPADSLRQVFARVVRDEWSGRAEPGSVSYRLVRHVAFNCVDAVYDLLTRACVAADPEFNAAWLPYRHAVAWSVIAARPAHLLPPQAADWDQLVLQAVDQVMAAVVGDVEAHTWGAIHEVVVAHPFAPLAPRLSRWLAAPPLAMPGDSFMPRVQHRRSGASERLVVSPGREDEGLFHMPGGQSGHPWSPFFLAGHDAWVTGAATPLLPGAPTHRLVLQPDVLQ